jgi:hypothetical protein
MMDAAKRRGFGVKAAMEGVVSVGVVCAQAACPFAVSATLGLTPWSWVVLAPSWLVLSAVAFGAVALLVDGHIRRRRRVARGG